MAAQRGRVGWLVGWGGEAVGVNTGRDLLIRLPLRLLWVAGAALGFTQRADGGVAVNLLVTGQAGLPTEREKEKLMERRRFPM